MTDALPDWLGQVIRYGLVGGFVASIYVLGSLVLSGPAGVPIAVAVAVSYVIAVSGHFILQRTFVFRHGTFALSVRAQLARYAAFGAVYYSVTLAAIKVLPSLLDVSDQVAYLCVTAVMTLVGFVALRGRVFHPHS